MHKSTPMLCTAPSGLDLCSTSMPQLHLLPLMLASLQGSPCCLYVAACSFELDKSLMSQVLAGVSLHQNDALPSMLVPSMLLVTSPCCLNVPCCVMLCCYSLPHATAPESSLNLNGCP